MTTPSKAAQVLMIGLGRMGGNMAKRLARQGIDVHGFDPSSQARDALSDQDHLQLHDNLTDAMDTLTAPRVVWLMLPAGDITEQTLTLLDPLLDTADVLVDGGNANYQDTQRRAKTWTDRGVEYVDCGVSGGVWGLDNGYCLMAGGSDVAIERIAPIFDALATATPDGWLHCGAVGSGHYTKMIHNGIEYGMMQAMAEGFALLDGHEQFDLDLGAISKLWQNGSVVRSWLLDLTASALVDPENIATVAPVVSDSGEGRWTVDEAVRQGIPAPVIAAALMSRFDSQGHADTTNRLLSLMRNAFGGHAIQPNKR